MLSPRDLAMRLVDCGLIDTGMLLHGGLTLDDASHRNHDVTIARRGKAILFVKQPVDGAGTIEHEARAYRILARHAGLARIVPALRHHESGLLVLAAVSGETLAVHAERTRRIARSVAADLGRAVALLHDSRSPIPAPPVLPWILSLGAPPLGILTRASAAGIEILRIVRESREIRRGLAALRDDWQGATPLHNDLRLENCILERRRRRRRVLKLVDWELAATGDAAWDVGSAIAAILSAWLFSLRYAPGMSIAQIARTATIPLARVRPAARTFWQTYAAARGLESGARAELRARSLRFAAARILQLSWERSLHAARPGAEVICAIQASANIFEDPTAAAATLLGMKGRGAHRA